MTRGTAQTALWVVAVWLLIAAPLWAQPTIFPEPLSPRIANYAIDVRLDTDGRALSAHEVLTWHNRSADTLGELEGFMMGADIVFMGGSLIPHGGQNILEPGRLGKPIVFGPHMENFSEETQLLLQAEGAKQASDSHALQDTFSDWLANPETAIAYGQRAAQVMAQQNNVLDGYLESVSRLCQLEGK